MRAVQYVELKGYTYEEDIDEETGLTVVTEIPVYQVVGDNFDFYIRSIFGDVINLSFETESTTSKAIFTDIDNMPREVYFEFEQDEEVQEGDSEYINDTPEYEYPPEYTGEGLQPEYLDPDPEPEPDDQPDSGDNGDPVVPEEEIPADVPGDYPGSPVVDPDPSGDPVLPGDPSEEASSEDEETWDEEIFDDPYLDPDYGYGDKSDGEEDIPEEPPSTLGEVWTITDPEDRRYYPEPIVANHNLIYEELSWKSNGYIVDLTVAYDKISPMINTDVSELIISDHSQITYSRYSPTRPLYIVSAPIEYDPKNYYRFEFDLEFGEEYTIPGIDTSATPPNFVCSTYVLDSTNKIVGANTISLFAGVFGSLVPGNSYSFPWSFIKNPADPYEDFPVKPTPDAYPMTTAGVLKPGDPGVEGMRIAMVFYSTLIEVTIRGFRVYANPGPLAA